MRWVGEIADLQDIVQGERVFKKTIKNTDVCATSVFSIFYLFILVFLLIAPWATVPVVPYPN